MNMINGSKGTLHQASRTSPVRAALLAATVAASLSSCGKSGITEEPGDGVEGQPAFSGSTQPSHSAEVLTSDTAHSIQTALAFAAGKQPSDTKGAAQEQTQTPDFEPAAALPDNENLAPEIDPEPEPAEPEPAEPEPEDGPTKGGPASENGDSGVTPEPTDPGSNQDNPDDSNAEPSQNGSPLPDSETATDTDPGETRFTSTTTPGFNGEVLSDSIRVSWENDGRARGYNVYRQAAYIATVFTNEYIDDNVYDSNYYYEIQAFDYDENYFYVATGLTVKARTLGRADPEAPVANADLLTDYELVFAEEFEGNSLDTSKWNTSFLWGTDLFINSEEQYYVDVANDPDFGFNPFSFDGNHLTITSIKTPPELAEKAQNQPYLSGLITSYDSFKFTYGYAETRAKLTHGRGYWPAFWLLNAYYVDAKPEIDIMEFIGDNQDVVYHTYHYFDTDGNLRSTESMPTVGIDFTADFHTFAVEWKPSELIFYVDGIETYRVTDANVSSQEMYVIANTAIGGWWAGSPDESTPFPGKYVIDYIRVYQKTTPYDDVLLDDGQTNIPLADDLPGLVRSPNHRPPFELWPEGYPDGL